MDCVGLVVQSRHHHHRLLLIEMTWFMVFNSTFDNISVISWRTVLFVEGTGVPRENYRPVASH
jgi:hypothetical protein